VGGKRHVGSGALFFVKGGMVQGVIADDKDTQVIIIDSDCENGGSNAGSILFNDPVDNDVFYGNVMNGLVGYSPIQVGYYYKEIERVK
jgi:hypothetical protein